MNCQLLLCKCKHLGYSQHITGHFPEKHKARSHKGNPTIQTQLQKVWHSVFHIYTMTCSTSLQLKQGITSSPAYTSLFHWFASILSPSSSGTEEEVARQQCPTSYLCGFHQVFFTISHKPSWLGKKEMCCVSVFSLPLGLQSLGHLFKEMYFKMNNTWCWQADLQ